MKIVSSKFNTKKTLHAASISLKHDSKGFIQTSYEEIHNYIKSNQKGAKYCHTRNHGLPSDKKLQTLNRLRKKLNK